MDSFECAPVLLIGFNRPDFMSAQIDALRPARPRRLYIAVDGPRASRPDEAELCRRTRECAALVDWPCDVKTLFREANLGCKLGVSGAIDWFFENEPEGMVLEDDCRPTVDFLRFATEMLERWRDDARIGAVCGFNHFNLQSDKTASYHFSSHMDVWGWASWRRVWKDYDVEMRGYAEAVPDAILKSGMTAYAKKFLRGHVEALARGLSTWDVQFSCLFLVKGLLTVVPSVRLVANAGIDDERATHTGGYSYTGGGVYSKACSIEFPLVHPAAVSCDDAADRMRERMEGAILPRAFTWVGCKFPGLAPLCEAIGRPLEKALPILFRI